MPEDPITEAQQMAYQLHELYMTYIEAGFDENQAFQLLTTFISTTSNEAA